jgi:hypothetical protein
MYVSDSSPVKDKSAPFDWRQHLKIHPAADLFPLMSESELKELAEDIEKNGLQVQIVLGKNDLHGLVLSDGRNRLDAMARLGWLSANRKGELV